MNVFADPAPTLLQSASASRWFLLLQVPLHNIGSTEPSKYDCIAPEEAKLVETVPCDELYELPLLPGIVSDGKEMLIPAWSAVAVSTSSVVFTEND